MPSHISELFRSSEALFTLMPAAFAHRNFGDVAAGVRPTVELTLRGSSWLAGKYRGYEEFSQYVAGAALVLTPAGKQFSFHHEEAEMTVIHDFIVGSGPTAVEMP